MATDTPGTGAGPDQPEPEAAPPVPAEPAPPQDQSPTTPAWATPPPPAADQGSGGGALWGSVPQGQPAAQPAPTTGWGAPPAASPEPAPSPAGWGAPAEPSGWGSPTPQAPAASAPTGWSSPTPQAPAPAPVAQSGWGSQAPEPSASSTGWGSSAPEAPAPAPQAPAPQPQGWGAPQPAPQSAPQGGWVATPQPQAPAWGQPAQPQPAWTAAPPPQPPASQPPASQPPQPAPPQPGGWSGAPAGGPAWNAAPPPQGPAPQPGWGGPGQPGFAPAPAQGNGNGCLKGCLIIGAILVVLAIIAVVGVMLLGFKLASDAGIDPNSPSGLKECPIVSSQQLKPVLGSDAEAHPMSGLINATLGQALDKRVLTDAETCWVGSSGNADATPNPGSSINFDVTGGFGRIARYSGGDAASVFSNEKAKAQSGKYYAVDVKGAGDEAFCTGASDAYPATGALVRKGNDVVYVSFLLGSYSDFFDQTDAPSGISYSPNACNDGVKIAQLAFH